MLEGRRSMITAEDLLGRWRWLSKWSWVTGSSGKVDMGVEGEVVEVVVIGVVGENERVVRVRGCSTGSNIHCCFGAEDRLKKRTIWPARKEIIIKSITETKTV